MKRIFALTLILCVCILLVSCGDANQTFLNADPIFSSADPTFSRANSQFETKVDNTSGGDEYSLCFENWDEYKEYVESNDLVENFITYDMISRFGEFKSFGSTGYSTLQYGQYWYEIVDANGEEYFISIDHYAEDSAERYNFIQNAEQKVNTSDLRTINAKEAGVHEIDNIMYFYTLNGELLRIRWCIGDIAIFLSGEVSKGGLSKIDIHSEKTGIRGLLDAKTAKETLVTIYGEKFEK